MKTIDNKPCSFEKCKYERCYYEDHVITREFCEKCADDADYIFHESIYSNDINQFIRNFVEVEYYMTLNLKECDINGRPCLVRDDLVFVVPIGKDCLTNAERIKKGNCPIDPLSNNQRMHLHHIGQKPDSPLAELTAGEDMTCRGNGIHYPEESLINRSEFKKDRKKHWEKRLVLFQQQNANNKNELE